MQVNAEALLAGLISKRVFPLVEDVPKSAEFAPLTGNYVGQAQTHVATSLLDFANVVY